MTRKITVAGFGGQGVMLLGQTLAYAGNEAGLNTLWYPSYGPETRGGTANCAVTISSDPINSPTFLKATTLIILNPPSLEKFKNRLMKGGDVLYNSNMILDEVNIEDASIYPIPANDIASLLGNPMVSNMVMLGGYLALYGDLSKDIIWHSLQEMLGEKRKHLLEINIKAIEMGYNTVKGMMK